MAQGEKAIGVKQIGKCKVVSSSWSDQAGKQWSKGVITGVPVSVSTKEIRENLRGGVLVNAQRLQAIRGGDRVDSTSILLTFKDRVLPNKVTKGYMSYYVRAYVPKPLRCYKCQRFGHVATVCKEKKRCARCGGEHEYGKCGEGVQPKCCNCGGAHSVAYSGCEAMKKTVEVQQVRVERRVSYAEAVRVVQERTVSYAEAVRVVQVQGDTGSRERRVGASRLGDGAGGQVGSDMVYIEKRKLVTFIAGAINSTDKVESKTERIKLIVKAAGRHLSMTGLTWMEMDK
ncbi:hypothetical protein J4Q44_G00115690 [Coregonus suidteri]|uniref:CCHC-type domain-containing protein n=1 Tax=Coregonus suidteri TaxID=861788 RepID=A0AAN8LW21_9TELE